MDNELQYYISLSEKQTHVELAKNTCPKEKKTIKQMGIFVSFIPN